MAAELEVTSDRWSDVTMWLGLTATGDTCFIHVGPEVEPDPNEDTGQGISLTAEQARKVRDFLSEVYPGSRRTRAATRPA